MNDRYRDAKPTRRFARPEWRVSAKADAHINGVECLELVESGPLLLKHDDPLVDFHRALLTGIPASDIRLHGRSDLNVVASAMPIGNIATFSDPGYCSQTATSVGAEHFPLDRIPGNATPNRCVSRVWATRRS
ncbi:hypothetical protein [Sphingomonas sp. Leaf4]|uniref:hypothetical protein n=1 Tax=Sphingomonas sp. Leaf4 TaxID=2876553 RepID=UPI001E594908|nr:hypothetical protein [Sphingomonas sp. Leaf4]